MISPVCSLEQYGIYVPNFVASKICMTKLIASPVIFSCEGVFLVYVSTSYHVTKLAKWMELIYSELNFVSKL